MDPGKRNRILTRIDKHAKRLALVGLILLLIQSIYVNWAVFHEKSQRAKQITQAICSVIKAIPPGNWRIDQMRTELNCGKYTSPTIPLESLNSPSDVPSLTPTPSDEPAIPTPGQSPISLPTPTITYRITPPPATVTHSVTATRTVSPSGSSPPSTSESPPLLGPVCQLLGLVC